MINESISSCPVRWRKITAAVADGKRIVLATALLVHCVVGFASAVQAETSDRLNMLLIMSVTRHQTLLIEQRNVAAGNPELLARMRGQMDRVLKSIVRADSGLADSVSDDSSRKSSKNQGQEK